MNIQWRAKVKWAGNLQNVPLPGTTRVLDYKQLQPGLVIIDILCQDRIDLMVLIAEITKDNWCSEIHAEPFILKG